MLHSVVFISYIYMLFIFFKYKYCFKYTFIVSESNRT
nr:MAG TPA: hypothetical protein [Bacteriophage sp.]